MEKTVKTNLSGKIIATIASVLMVVFALCHWIDISPIKDFIKEETIDDSDAEEIEEILDEFDDGYSIIEVPKTIETFIDEYRLDNICDEGTLDKIHLTSVIIIVLIIFMGIINIAFAWYSYKAAKVVTVISCILCTALAAGFLEAVLLFNLGASLIGNDEIPNTIIKSTYFPLWMVLSSIMACLAVRLKQNVKVQNVPPVPYISQEPVNVRRCSKCGAVIEPGNTFCVVCGHNINEVQNTDTSAQNTDAEQTFSIAAGKICPNCGTNLPEDAAFCKNCGSQV